MSSIQADYQAPPPDERKLTGHGDLQTWVEDWARVHRSVRRVAEWDVFNRAPEPGFTDSDIHDQAVKVRERFNLPLYAGRTGPIQNPEALADRLAAGLDELFDFANTLESKLADFTQPLGPRRSQEWKGKVRLIQAYEKETRRQIGQLIASGRLSGTATQDALQQTAACQSQLCTALSDAATTLVSLQRSWPAHVRGLTNATTFKEVLEYIDTNRGVCECPPLSSMFLLGNRQYDLEDISQALTAADEQGERIDHAMLRFSDSDCAGSVVDMACAATNILEMWVRASLRDFCHCESTQQVTRGSPTWTSVELTQMTSLPPSMPDDVRDQAAQLPTAIKTIMALQERLDDLPTGRVRRMLQEGTMTAMGAKSTGAGMAEQSNKETEQARPAEDSIETATRMMSLRSREVEWSS